MPSPDFINPLQNSLFIPILLRLDLTFLIFFLLIALMKKFNWDEIIKSNLGQRYFGWLILTPFYILGVFFGRIPGLFMLFVFLCLAIIEISQVAKLPKAYKYSLFFLSLVSVIVASYWTQLFYSLPILYFMIITMVSIRRNESKTGFFYASTTLFYAIWIIFGLCHFILLSHLSNTLSSTKLLVIIVIFAVSLSDVGAYVIGKYFHKINFLDKYKIADTISPNKTYVGILGHIIGAFIGILIFYIGFEKIIAFHHVVILSVLIGVFGIIGGLTNSMFKRYFEVKDSSQLIPGLGGVMDRIDSLVRVVVVLYYYLLFIL
jgi:phosphatidate cytidylyltransferase